MTQENLEPSQTPVEPPKVVSEKEPTGKVSPEIEAKVSGEEHQEETFTKKQQDQAIKDALEQAEKEWQPRKDKEFASLTQQNRELREKIEGAELAAKEGRELEKWGDFPPEEVKEFHEARRKLFEEQTQHQTVIAEVNKRAKTIAANDLSAKYGVEKDSLMEAENPEAMESLAVKLAYEKLVVKGEPPKEPVVEPDSGVKSAPGIDWANLTPDEKIRRALNQPPPKTK